ncbi:DNA-processing protein DprA [Halosquirtibacter xylanolyticus]|uniref:DNA-processing protein DprA n=1 Tax=Halosquirtibacter xylanolyticus TaxID=3374599 RepID=UPI0037490375|nr:DNA-processing protein DprA [Prolixibacteraceae bacterium]
MDYRVYSIALSMVPKIDREIIDRLVAYCGDMSSIFLERASVLERETGISRKIIDTLLSSDILIQAEKELERMDKYDIQCVFYQDANYPFKLLQVPDFPLMIYYRGTLPENDHHSISIIGTRAASNYGIRWIDGFVKSLSDQFNNLDILSGLAYGIDYEAHKKSLEYGVPTYAVLGHGLHTIYPSAHHRIAEEIVRSGGGLITEFTTTQSIRPQNFLQRNRVVAALSDATIVVESKAKGGAMHTANMAFSYAREVFALPGSVQQATSTGCHLLIQRQVAALIASDEDLLRVMEWEPTISKERSSPATFHLELDEIAVSLLDFIKAYERISIDEIASKTGIEIAKLSSLLTQLEFMGQIEVLPGKYYRSI